MFSRVLIIAVAIGAAAAASLHRFASPASFSFQTNHQPAAFAAHPFQFSIPSRFAASAGKTLSPQVVNPVNIPEVKVAIVDAPDLSAKSISSPKTVEPVVEVEQAVAADVMPKEPSAVDNTPKEAISEPVIAPISATDDAFTLTNNEPASTDAAAAPAEQTVDKQVVDSAADNAAPEAASANVEAASASTQQAILPVQTAAENAAAHQEFLNTWLRLASVNLNRPTLLNLLQPVAPVAIVPTPAEVAASTVVQPEETPAVEVPQEIVNEPIVEVTTLTPEIIATTEEEIISTTLAPAEVVEVAPEVIKPVDAMPKSSIDETAAKAVEIQTNEIPRNNINVLPPQITLTPVPVVSSRGRFSGFTYRFLHNPKPSRFFFNHF